MKSNIFLQVIIFLFYLFATPFVQAETFNQEQASTWVNDRGRELLTLFGEKNLAIKYAGLDRMLNDCIDLEYVSKFVIGKYWRQMNSEQQLSYQTLFKRYALSIYKAFPLDFNTDKINFNVVEIIPENDNFKVRIKLNLAPDNPSQDSPLGDIFVDFILHQKGDKIKIIDLKLGESSLILSYRSRFYEMLAGDDNDIDWFLEDLTDITTAAERTNAQKLQQTIY